MAPRRGKGIIASMLLTTALLFGVLNTTGAALLEAGETTSSEVAIGDVVVNEVAWMGTAASTYDEWIELHNTSTMDIDLSGWNLQGSNNDDPNINLTGTIPAGGYYLLERTDNTTVSDVDADLIFTGNLFNEGESLTLKDSSGRVIDTANGDGGAWPGGDNDTKSTMERIDPLAPDSDANWATNDGITRNGHDADNNPLNGTPKAPNSAFSVTPPALADLRVMKNGPPTATQGDILTYTLQIRNGGSSTAAATYVTDTLPTGIAFITSSLQPVMQSGNLVVWHAGDLVPGETLQFSMTGLITASVPAILVNHLHARTAITESSLLNNFAVWTTTLTEAPLPRPNILINAVLYDGYVLSDEDEAIQLLNPGDNAVSMCGWEICKISDNEIKCRALPNMELPAKGHVWLTRSLSAFEQSFGFAADHLLSPWLTYGLSNSGDEVILRDENHEAVDTLVFGDGALTAPGWVSEPLRTYQNNVARAEGQILYRIPDEVTGMPISDTNTLADWMQHTYDIYYGRRVVYPGWDFVTPFFWPTKAEENATLIVGVTPDNGFAIISNTVALAQRSIKVEAYTWRHGNLTDMLVAKAQAGLSVTLLLEGGPVGIGETDPRWQAELYACQLLENAGGRCFFQIHQTEDHIFSRYDFIHAKFILVDDAWTVITSQNFGNSSIPSDDKSNGTFGSRGVVVATDSPSIASRVAAVFAADCDPLHHTDTLRWNTGDDSRYGMPLNPVDLHATDALTYTITIPNPLIVTGTMDFELFTAPEAALRQEDALLGLIARARAGDTVYIQQLYEYPEWGEEPLNGPNLRLQAYVDAARRGARVRILLNGGDFDQEIYDLTKNRVTVGYVNQVARNEGLDLRANIGDPTDYGIHNKMVLVELGDSLGYIHVGSINGSESSSKVNREIALQVQSNAAFSYLESMFLSDWHRVNPTYLPLILSQFSPPQHLLISEVYYATSDTNREWVEIYNPTAHQFDLGNYKLGDAAAATDYEALYRFPEGTIIQPGQVLVIAVSGAYTPAADFEMINDTEKPDMVRVTDWGTGNWTLANPGDQVILLGDDNQPVDVLVWGTALFEGVVPHPGVAIFSSSLERVPPDTDTDDCAVDFRERSAPSPGDLP